MPVGGRGQALVEGPAVGALVGVRGTSVPPAGPTQVLLQHSPVVMIVPELESF